MIRTVTLKNNICFQSFTKINELEFILLHENIIL